MLPQKEKPRRSCAANAVRYLKQFHLFEFLLFFKGMQIGKNRFVIVHDLLSFARFVKNTHQLYMSGAGYNVIIPVNAKRLAGSPY